MLKSHSFVDSRLTAEWAKKFQVPGILNLYKKAFWKKVFLHYALNNIFALLDQDKIWSWEDAVYNSFETVSNTLTVLTQGKYITLRKYPAFRNHNFILQILRNEMPLESATFVK